MKYANLENLPGILEGSYQYKHTPTNMAENLLLYIEQIGHQFTDRRYCLSRSSYSNYLMMYLLDGKGVLFSEGRDYFLEAGQAFLIQTKKPHIYGACPAMECIWVHFNGKHFDEFFEYLKAVNGSHVFQVKNQLDFTSRFFALLADQDAPHPQPEIMVSARLYELLALLVVNPPDSSETPVDAAISYINRHYGEEISLEMLAKHASMSVSRLSTVFKLATGYAPYQYIINTRLHAAYQMLAGSANSVEQIALDCGFNDVSSFILRFRKKYNITPAKFRKSLQDKVIP